ncbi:MAG: lamin tail domain-containing protein [Myxococcota bacterium]
MCDTHPHTALGLLLALFGCIPSAPPPMDAATDSPSETGAVDAAALQAQALHVFDRNGVAWPRESAPWKPILELRFNGPPPAELWLLSLANTSVEGVFEDFERAPVRVAHRDAAVATSVELEASYARITPEDVLEPGAYVLAAGTWSAAALEGPVVEAFVVARAGGARLVAAWPPSGAGAVPIDLPRACAGFDGPVDGALRLLDGASVIDAFERTVPCATAALPGAECRCLELPARLRPFATYRFDVRELRDVSGRALEREVSFSTSSDPPAPAPGPATCAFDEQLDPLGCVGAYDDRIWLSLSLGAPALVEWSLDLQGGGARWVKGRAPRGELRLELAGLRADTTYRSSLDVTSLSGAHTRFESEATTAPPLPMLYITEVRADPLGPEPHQEFVELHNAGSAPLDLNGWQLADAPERVGDVLQGHIAPGLRALITAPTFDANALDDGALREGVTVLRQASSLGSGGLRNGGEPLFIRDAQGQRIAEFPSVASPAPGQCAQSAYGRAPTVTFGPCTPGYEKAAALRTKMDRKADPGE